MPQFQIVLFVFMGILLFGVPFASTILIYRLERRWVLFFINDKTLAQTAYEMRLHDICRKSHAAAILFAFVFLMIYFLNFIGK